MTCLVRVPVHKLELLLSLPQLKTFGVGLVDSHLANLLFFISGNEFRKESPVASHVIRDVEEGHDIEAARRELYSSIMP